MVCKMFVAVVCSKEVGALLYMDVMYSCMFAGEWLVNSSKANAHSRGGLDEMSTNRKANNLVAAVSVGFVLISFSCCWCWWSTEARVVGIVVVAVVAVVAVVVGRMRTSKIWAHEFFGTCPIDPCDIKCKRCEVCDTGPTLNHP